MRATKVLSLSAAIIAVLALASCKGPLQLSDASPDPSPAPGLAIVYD